jgi:hypothetical protein
MPRVWLLLGFLRMLGLRNLRLWGWGLRFRSQ